MWPQLKLIAPGASAWEPSAKNSRDGRDRWCLPPPPPPKRVRRPVPWPLLEIEREESRRWQSDLWSSVEPIETWSHPPLPSGAVGTPVKPRGGGDAVTIRSVEAAPLVPQPEPNLAVDFKHGHTSLHSQRSNIPHPSEDVGSGGLEPPPPSTAQVINISRPPAPESRVPPPTASEPNAGPADISLTSQAVNLLHRGAEGQLNTHSTHGATDGDGPDTLEGSAHSPGVVARITHSPGELGLQGDTDSREPCGQDGDIPNKGSSREDCSREAGGSRRRSTPDNDDEYFRHFDEPHPSIFDEDAASATNTLHSRSRGPAAQEDKEDYFRLFGDLAEGDFPSLDAKMSTPPHGDETLDAKVSTEAASPHGDKTLLYFPANGIGRVNITEPDLARLRPGEFLNDTLVEFSLKHWMERLRASSPEIASQVHVFSPFWYEKLSKNSMDEGYLSVFRWTSRFDLFLKKYVVVPVHERLHWYLAVIYEPEHVILPRRLVPKPKVPAFLPGHTYILILDSLGQEHDHVCTRLSGFLLSEARERKGIRSTVDILSRHVQVPRQPNFHDCGLYTIHFAETFVSDAHHLIRRIFDTTTAEEREELWQTSMVSTMRPRLLSVIETLCKERKRMGEAKAQQADTSGEGGEVEIVCVA